MVKTALISFGICNKYVINHGTIRLVLDIFQQCTTFILIRKYTLNFFTLVAMHRKVKYLIRFQQNFCKLNVNFKIKLIESQKKDTAIL